MFIALICLFNSCQASEDSTVVLNDGEVWLKYKKSKEKQVTHTGGKIDKIEIAPSQQFASANKIIGYYEQENDIENPTAYTQEPEYSVLIIDLTLLKIIADLKTPRETTHPLGWQPDDTYRYGEGSPLDIHTYYEFNPATGEIKELNDL